MNIIYGFDSETWWSDIVRFTQTFLDFVNKQAGDESIVKLKSKDLEKVK